MRLIKAFHPVRGVRAMQTSKLPIMIPSSASTHIRRLFTGSTSVLDEWVRREARPISLRQLTFFGRTLTEERLISSANYVRMELPTRIAHRLRDMQTLPYAVVTNSHMSHVYDLYYKAFDEFRRVPEIKSIEGNDIFCRLVASMLKEHLTVIPRLATGVLEVQNLMTPEDTDKLMTTLLRSRISRRVIAEQHLALTKTFHSPEQKNKPDADFIGEVFLKCDAREVVERVGNLTRNLIQDAYGPTVRVPEIKIQGHLDATFPYILSHLEYILGELLRNSLQAVIEERRAKDAEIPPIEVLICESASSVIFRLSDKGGGIPREILGHIWSFSKGPQRRLENLGKVTTMAAKLNEVSAHVYDQIKAGKVGDGQALGSFQYENSLSSLYGRTPGQKLGIGLPMSRIYAQYWSGSLEIHNLEGYGIDAFLQISKLGNKNEEIATRARMDAL